MEQKPKAKTPEEETAYMIDLNMVNAHNAELRSIGSPAGLPCDAPSSAPDRALADEFRRAMDAGANDAGSGQRALPGHEKDAGPEQMNAPAAGESFMPFSSLFSMAAGISSTSVSESGAVCPPLSPEALEALVDRILVSSSEMGRAEVRLTLSDNVLGGTEIMLSRGIDGQLVVSLQCISESSFQTLVASQMDLKSRLEDIENRSVQVSVDIDREDGNADRRSRGHIEQDQQEA